MDPKAIFIASPPSVGVGAAEPDYYVKFPSITIGNQIWMAQDLDITTLYTGESISYIYDLVVAPDGTLINLIDNHVPLWSWREFDDSNRYPGYSKIYSYDVVASLITNPPKGWKMPTLSDWTTLINFLGGNSTAGGYLKGPDNYALWNSMPNVISDQYSFNANPTGIVSAQLAVQFGVFPPVDIGYPFLNNTGNIVSYWIAGPNYYTVNIIGNQTIATLGSSGAYIDNWFSTTGDTGFSTFSPIRLLRNI
jgi:uncharacterized protein (TIGR02145 family)